MNSEISDRKWFWGGVGLQLAVGYIVAFLVFQIGTLITTGNFGAGFVPGLCAVAAIAAFVAHLALKSDKKEKVKV